MRCVESLQTAMSAPLCKSDSVCYELLPNDCTPYQVLVLLTVAAAVAFFGVGLFGLMGVDCPTSFFGILGDLCGTAGSYILMGCGGGFFVLAILEMFCGKTGKKHTPPAQLTE